MNKVRDILKKLPGLVLNKINFVVIGLLLLAFLFVMYYIYKNVYQIAISPKPISTNTITAKKQKVNIELITQVNKNIQTKKDIKNALPQITHTPFKQ